MMDLGSVKKDFSVLLSQVQPWTLSHFVMWLDIKVAEYKVFGRMIMDNTPNDTPQWLRASADYLEQQHKEAQAAAAMAEQDEKGVSPPAQAPPPPALSPTGRTAHAIAAMRPLHQQLNSSYEPVTSFATSSSSQYTISTVNTTVVSPNVSPAFPAMAPIRPPPPPPAESFQKQDVPVTSPDIYAKNAAPLGHFAGFHTGTQRIPPISHLSPKHIRQSHLDQSLSMSLPVSLATGALGKDMLPGHTNKESLSTAEVETQIAVLESQIAAVNRSLKQSAHLPSMESINQTASTATPSSSKSGRRKASDVSASSTDDVNSTFVPPSYPKKSRQQSPVSANRTSVESTLPPLHSSMDMLARMHRLDADSIPESLRSHNIQSTLEAFEALRTQTFPPNLEALRTQSSTEVEAIQNTAQDMSMHHATVAEREQLAAYAASVEREQSAYPVVATDREQTYTPTSVERDTPSAVYNLQSDVQVKVEAGQSDEDSLGGENAALRVMATENAADLQNAHGTHVSGGEENQTYPVSMYPAASSNAATPDEKLAAEISTKKMRRKFLESMKNSNPKYYSHQIQQIIPFPEKFPVANLDYGLKALQMIQTGEITRAGKIQLIDTIFHELIKYTGLYPTPTQKMAVANSIVETFPTLAAKMKASHISPADSWYVILCDKFRNERRGLSGSGGSPRVSKSSKVVKEDPDASVGSLNESASLEATEEATVEVRTTEEETHDDSSQHPVPTATPPVSQTTPTPQQQQQQQQQFAGTAAAAVAHAAYHHQAYPTTQVTVKEQALHSEMMSEEDEEDLGDAEKLLLNTEERRLYAEKVKRSVRRKTHSPKRVQKADTPILDERYAASLLEYYSKHKPYYPGDGDLNRSVDMENLKTSDASLVIDDKAVTNSAAVTQALAQAVASSAVSGNQDEPYSAEVAAIVQSVVSAHMDEVLAARNYQAQLAGDAGQYQILNQPQEVEGTVEVKTSKKKVKLQQKERTPEQLQVNLQRFKQKLAITYPGVQAVDDATLLCTCGTKVKLGRARMLHNYTNYHLKRCQNPPSTVTRMDSHSPSSATPSSVQSMYVGSPGELNIPSSGPKVIAKEVESSAGYTGLSAADRETIQKHFLLNVPVPQSENMTTLPSSSTPPSQTLDLTMPVSGQATATVPSDLSMAVAGHNASSLSVSDANSMALAASEAGMLTISGAPGTVVDNAATLSITSASSSRPTSVAVTTVTAGSDSELKESQSLDLSVHTSGPTVLIEHQPGSNLRMQIPGSIATSIAEYSGELPDLSAMNALSMIQGKSDQHLETMDTESSDEPMNLADS